MHVPGCHSVDLCIGCSPAHIHQCSVQKRTFKNYSTHLMNTVFFEGVVATMFYPLAYVSLKYKLYFLYQKQFTLIFS